MLATVAPRQESGDLTRAVGANSSHRAVDIRAPSTPVSDTGNRPPGGRIRVREHVMKLVRRCADEQFQNGRRDSSGNSCRD
jgi:hypothetical protein